MCGSKPRMRTCISAFETTETGEPIHARDPASSGSQTASRRSAARWRSRVHPEAGLHFSSRSRSKSSDMAATEMVQQDDGSGGGRIAALEVAGHSGVHELTADAFVDATGEADLASFAGASVRYGNDGMVQNGSLGVRFGGVPANVDLSKARVKQAVRAARAQGVGPLISEQGLFARLPISGDVITYLVDEGYDARDAREVSRAETSARRQSTAYLQVMRTFLRCPAAYIVSTGPELGTRESRHVVPRYRLSEDDVLGAACFDDAVAVAAWPIEYHPGPGIPSRWGFISGRGCFAIPLGALCGVGNGDLFAAGRNIDGDRGAGASVRVMGTAFATGQAAGVAASMRADRGAFPDVAAVRAELVRQGTHLTDPCATTVADG